MIQVIFFFGGGGDLLDILSFFFNLTIHKYLEK